MKVLIFGILFSVLAFGQTFQGTLRGRILDPAGNPTSAAKVAITDEATQVGRATISNDQGDYVFTAVNPATYTLTAEIARLQEDSSVKESPSRPRPSSRSISVLK